MGELDQVCTVLEGDSSTIKFIKERTFDFPVAGVFKVHMSDYEVGCINPYQRCVINSKEAPLTYTDTTFKRTYSCVVVKTPDPHLRIYEHPFLEQKREVTWIYKMPSNLYLILFQHEYIADWTGGHESVPVCKVHESVSYPYESSLVFSYRRHSIIPHVVTDNQSVAYPDEKNMN